MEPSSGKLLWDGTGDIPSHFEEYGGGSPGVIFGKKRVAIKGY